MSAFAFSTVPASAPSATSALGTSIEAATEALLRARDEVISALDRQVVELQNLHSALASTPMIMEAPEEEPYVPSFLVPETELSPAAVASSLFAQAPTFSGPALPPMMNEAPPLPPMPVPQPAPQMQAPAPVPVFEPLAPPPMMMPQAAQIAAAPPMPAPQMPQQQPVPVQMPVSPTPLPGLSWAASPPPAFMPSISSVAASFTPPTPAEVFPPASAGKAMAAPAPSYLPPPSADIQTPSAPPRPPAPSMMVPLTPPPAPAAPPPMPMPAPAAQQQRPGVTLPPPRGGNITFTTFKAPPPAPVRQPVVPPPMPAAAHAGGPSAFAPLPLVESKIDPTLERATLEELNDALASAFSTVSRK